MIRSAYLADRPRSVSVEMRGALAPLAKHGSAVRLRYNLWESARDFSLEAKARLCRATRVLSANARWKNPPSKTTICILDTVLNSYKILSLMIANTISLANITTQH